MSSLPYLLFVRLPHNLTSPHAGNTETVLARIIEQLGKLAADHDGQAGRRFRDEHAESSVTEATDVLVRNSQRRTYNNLWVLCPLVLYIHTCVYSSM
jgi:hypothetical protein